MMKKPTLMKPDVKGAPAPIPHLAGVGGYGGTTVKSVYSSTLPKVHLPRHQFTNHHHHPSNSLLPGILKTNQMLQPKSLHKTKLKVGVVADLVLSSQLLVSKSGLFEVNGFMKLSLGVFHR